MSPAQFIYSPKYKFRRHFAFWGGWWLFCTILYSFAPGLNNLSVKFLISAIEAAVYMIPHAFLSYALIYFVIPKLLLREKYLLSAITVLAIVGVTAGMSAVLSLSFLTDMREALIPPVDNKPYQRDHNQTFFLSLLAGLRGAVTIAGMAAAIKLMKHWSGEAGKIAELQKGNIESQLQLLKAQVHPHFLFNTLNNIYSYSQNNPVVASRLVMGLSDLLRYMLYECNQPLVPLNKELQMLEDYVTLEKIRYGNRLEVNFEIPKRTGDFRIAPLLLLPFVENSFKHGTSQVLDQPWISIAISFAGNTMQLKIVNGKPDAAPASRSQGLGINNVRRRLELLYPNRYQLKISNDPEVFIVDLKIDLERVPKVPEQELNKIEAAAL